LDASRFAWKQAGFVFLGTIILGGLLSSAYWLGQTNARGNPVPAPVASEPMKSANATKITTGTTPTLFPADESICKHGGTLPPVKWTQCDNLRIKNISLTRPNDPIEEINLYMAKRIKLAFDAENGKINLADLNVYMAELDAQFGAILDAENEERERRKIRDESIRNIQESERRAQQLERHEQQQLMRQ
jgi:hypothetical protein